MDGRAIGLLAAQRLAERPVEIAPGLTDQEFAAIEDDFGFTFADDHRIFLAVGVPVGPRWPDWRTPSDALADQLRWPVDGLLFDVANNDFWYPAWGTRPEAVEAAVLEAVQRLAYAPRLVPIRGHRYLPAGRGSFGHPVLSMMQTDIVCYGRDLAAYIGRDQESRSGPVTVEFWRDLVS